MSIQNNLNIRDSARVSRLRSSANKVQPNLFCGCFNVLRITLHLFHKTGVVLLRVVILHGVIVETADALGCLESC